MIPLESMSVTRAYPDNKCGRTSSGRIASTLLTGSQRMLKILLPNRTEVFLGLSIIPLEALFIEKRKILMNQYNII